MFPFYAGLVHTARLALAVVKVEGLAEGGRQIDSSARRLARSISRKAIRNAHSCARDRGDTLRLSARLEWTLGNKPGALQGWTDARTECQRLGTLPELGRTFADMSVAMENVDNEWKTRAGLSRDTCRERAKTIFEELGCEWDLEQMDEIVRRKLRAA